MTDEKVTDEEVHSLRRIYEVLLRDAADVYADMQQGIDAFLYSGVLLTCLIGFMVIEQLILYRIVPPVTPYQWLGHGGIVAAYFVLGFFAFRWYRRYFFMRRKYAELLKIAREARV
jgi:hypothetical protein